LFPFSFFSKISSPLSLTLVKKLILAYWMMNLTILTLTLSYRVKFMWIPLYWKCHPHKMVWLTIFSKKGSEYLKKSVRGSVVITLLF
jgi:hypothetical protein